MAHYLLKRPGARRQAKPYEYKPKGLSEQEIIRQQAEAQDNE